MGPAQRFAFAVEGVLGQLRQYWVVGTDYPHAHTMGSWPNTVPVINAREDLSMKAKAGILGENAFRLFGIAA